jgi:hypothetical protein
VRLVSLLADVDKPCFLVLSRDGVVSSRIAAPASAVKFQKAIEAAHAKFPDESKRIAKVIAEQAKLLASARASLKADRRDEALAAYDQVRMSDVRTGPSWDPAMKEAYDLEQKMAREAAKADKKK